MSGAANEWRLRPGDVSATVAVHTKYCDQNQTLNGQPTGRAYQRDGASVGEDQGRGFSYNGRHGIPERLHRCMGKQQR
ncbi:hypothetical protein DPMN_080818 [Dreissena polymorpha]|uniref:Uncharacterized protein n=1 Tax=Dreissena polymorpha TaxID=45954 RepID=A0A9D3YVT2_DREPO|nr:hypothetical protein DPMN_080818 [Dreissena polymorpha]